LHILNKRVNERTDSIQQVSIYTNLKEAGLFVNDEFISKKAMNSDIHKIVWEHVKLKQGLNQIRVVAKDGDKQYTDNCEWDYKKLSEESK
jgi:hypothetical protein